MPMIVFQPQTRINSAGVNANFANSLALDTPRTVVVTHIWSARQQFNGGITVVGASTFSGNVTMSGPEFQASRFRATADGNVGNVAYGFESGGVGIYRESESDLRFVANNSGRMRITGSVIQALGTVAFTGNGSGLTDLHASRLTAGTVPNARISGAYSGITSLQVGSLRVGGAATFARIAAANLQANPTQIGTGHWVAQIPWNGTQTGDLVLVDNPWARTPPFGRQWSTSAHVNQANQVTVTIMGTAGATPTQQTVRLIAFRF